MRQRKQQPWYGDIQARLRFEGEARSQHPTLTVTRAGKGSNVHMIYRLTINVPEYEARKVEIHMGHRFEPYATSITADGPTDSPHRYGGARLCVWRPGDPPEKCLGRQRRALRADLADQDSSVQGGLLARDRRVAWP